MDQMNLKLTFQGSRNCMEALLYLCIDSTQLQEPHCCHGMFEIMAHQFQPKQKTFT